VFTRKIREVDGQQTTFQVGLTPRHFTLRLEGEMTRATCATTSPACA
jgi:hypothetical protein